MKHILAETLDDTFLSLELYFNQLQARPLFFVFELFLGIYLLINLAFIAERHMMPSLINISRRYSLSNDLTGIVVAVGGLVPELTTTVLSFMRHGIKMTEFGIASNVGSAIFTITVVPAIAIFLSGTDKIAESNSSLVMTPIYRDMGFFIIA